MIIGMVILFINIHNIYIKKYFSFVILEAYSFLIGVAEYSNC